jgi:hypothetical protein
MAFQTNRIQIDGSLNVDGSIYQYNQLFSPGGGGTGDVAWASSNLGEQYQLITANGDGSIVAESGITYNSGTDVFNVSGDLIVGDTVTIDGITLSNQTDRAGLLQISAEPDWNGIQTLTGTHRWSFLGGATSAGLYDDTNDKWSLLASKLGGVSIWYNGDIKLETASGGVDVTGNLTATGGLYASGLSSASTSNVVYYNTTSGALSYGAGSGGVSWNGSTSNAIGTYGGSSTIDAEPNLTFDGNILEFDSATDKTIKLKDLTSIDNTPQTLNILGAKGFGATLSSTQIGTYTYTYTTFSLGFNGGDVKVQAGQGADPNIINPPYDRGGAGGDLLLYGGPAGDPDGRKGNVVLNGAEIQIDSNFVDINYRLRHLGDEDTYLEFSPDAIRLAAGVGENAYEQQTIYSGGVVFNEDSQDYDFRIESDGDSSIFFVDGGSNSVWINRSAGVKISNTEVVFNEHSNDVDFRIESNNKSSAFWVDAGKDQIIVEDRILADNSIGSTTKADPRARITALGDDCVISSTSIDLTAEFAFDATYLSATNTAGTGIKFCNGNTAVYTGTGAIVSNRLAGYSAGELLFGVKHDSSATPPTSLPVFHSLDGYNQRARWFNSTGTEKIRFNLSTGQIDAAGDIVAYTTIFSDKRLKENIIPLENSLEKILKLRGISYDRKLNGENHLGYIAQEVEEFMPDVIIEKTLPLETGDEDTLYKTIKYQEIIPYITEAMKEQQKIIDDQKKEINELKQKMEQILEKLS